MGVKERQKKKQNTSLQFTGLTLTIFKKTFNSENYIVRLSGFTLCFRTEIVSLIYAIFRKNFAKLKCVTNVLFDYYF